MPSAEQGEIVEAAQRGMSLRVLAFAGTGKTTTVEMLARSLPRDRRILYVVFNKAQQVLAQMDAERTRLTGEAEAQVQTMTETAKASIYKKQRPPNYRLKNGQRQPLTVLSVTGIKAGK